MKIKWHMIFEISSSWSIEFPSVCKLFLFLSLSTDWEAVWASLLSNVQSGHHCWVMSYHFQAVGPIAIDWNRDYIHQERITKIQRSSYSGKPCFYPKEINAKKRTLFLTCTVWPLVHVDTPVPHCQKTLSSIDLEVELSSHLDFSWKHVIHWTAHQTNRCMKLVPRASVEDCSDY